MKLFQSFSNNRYQSINMCAIYLFLLRLSHESTECFFTKYVHGKQTYAILAESLLSPDKKLLDGFLLTFEL